MTTPAGIVLAVAVSLAWVRPAIADPAVRLEVTGDCPDAALARGPLGKWVQLDDVRDPDWVISITRRGRLARLVLADSSGRVSLSREIASDDCRGVAEAFAVIVHAQFVELRVVPPPGAAAPTAPGIQTGAPGVATAPAPAMPHDPPDGVATAARSGRIGAGDPGSSLAFGASAGLGVGVAPGSAQALGQLDAAWLARRRWVVRASVSAESPTTDRTEMDRVRQTRLSAAAGVGVRARPDPVWVQLVAGIGVAGVIVEPLDLPDGASRLRAHPAATFAGAVGMPISGSLSLRAELASALFLRVDRYSITPEGEVARSPRGLVSVALGVEWSVGQ